MTLTASRLKALPAEEAHRLFRAAPALERSALADEADDLTSYLVHLYLYDRDHEVRAALFSHPSLPVRHQRFVATSSHPGSVNGAFLAANPSLDVTVQELLAGAVNNAVRTALAANPSLHPSLHDRLLRDASPAVVDALLGNPTFTLRQDIPTAVLLRTPRGARFIREVLATCDPTTVEVLGPSWAGTLTELLAVARHAGPH